MIDPARPRSEIKFASSDWLFEYSTSSPTFSARRISRPANFHATRKVLLRRNRRGRMEIDRPYQNSIWKFERFFAVLAVSQHRLSFPVIFHLQFCGGIAKTSHINAASQMLKFPWFLVSYLEYETTSWMCSGFRKYAEVSLSLRFIVKVVEK